MSAPDGAPPASVLAVDDVAQNRLLLEQWLSDRGCRVDTAENGRIALAKVAAGHYDLILLDLDMPELDGYSTLTSLKSDAKSRDIPVIMISAVDELPEIARCIKAGAEDYLPKPFEPVLLAARVDASLERKRLRDAEKEYLAQVGRVIEAAQSLEAGSYSPGCIGDVAVRSDELGRLARVFNTMAVQVEARERRLKERLEALRSEIGAGNRTARPADSLASDVTVRLTSAGGENEWRDPALKLEPGTVFAKRFAIKSMLGAGGMGVVYRAHDTELDEEVAIKLLPPSLRLENETALERFKSEIRLARQIASPHVVRTHDFGEWEGIYYLTMEFAPGMTLRDLIRRRKVLTPSAVLGIAGQLARALDAAHVKHVIHRDIKPENLLLDEGGVLKIMDFGVALLVERAGWITKAGAIIGTPAYMAPEQLAGDPVDGRSDLYAVGVVMYECLTGRRPIDADSLFQLVARVLEMKPIPPADIVKEIPLALSDLVLRLLDKDRNQRPKSAAELAELLVALA
jgi:CheY-like chemotaxis protein